jgi:hypothetical protein
LNSSRCSSTRKAGHDIVILDGSWFDFATSHEPIWLPKGTEASDGEWITVWSRKTMVTIVWSSTGFYRIVALPKGVEFKADYYISHILDPLTEWRRSQVGARIEDCMSTRTMLAVTLRRRLLKSLQAMA